ncbi:HipA domain-containing protein [Trinickia sp.]|uniref:HipA domain-containing protein n=1 Tax=Trinickia sp. TaxID=2571163 RepID=UPI003F80202C
MKVARSGRTANCTFGSTWSPASNQCHYGAEFPSSGRRRPQCIAGRAVRSRRRRRAHSFRNRSYAAHCAGGAKLPMPRIPTSRISHVVFRARRKRMRRRCSGEWFFNVAMENTDDHEKNHAFLWQDRHWNLAPAYHVQPQLPGIHYH